MQHTNRPLDPATTTGLINHTYTVDDVELACWLEYEPAEGDGWNEPRHNERVTLVYALINGIDIAILLDEETRAAIEAETLAHMKAEANECFAEAA